MHCPCGKTDSAVRNQDAVEGDRTHCQLIPVLAKVSLKYQESEPCFCWVLPKFLKLQLFLLLKHFEFHHNEVLLEFGVIWVTMLLYHLFGLDLVVYLQPLVKEKVILNVSWQFSTFFWVSVLLELTGCFNISPPVKISFYFEEKFPVISVTC